MDGRVFTKKSVQWKRGLHVFHTTTAAPNHVECKVCKIGAV